MNNLKSKFLTIRRKNYFLNFEFLFLFLFVFEVGGYFITYLRLNELEVPFFLSINDPLFGCLLLSIILPISSLLKKFFKLRYQFLKDILLCIFLLIFIAYIESSNGKFYHSGFFISCYLNVIAFIWFKNLKQEDALFYFNLLITATIVVLILSLFDGSVFTLNRLILETLVFIFVKSQLTLGTPKKIINNDTVGFGLGFLLSVISSFRIGLVISSISFITLLFSFKNLKNNFISLSFLIFLLICFYLGIDYFVSKILVDGKEGSIIKSLVSNNEMISTTNKCDFYFAEQNAVREFINFLHIFEDYVKIEIIDSKLYTNGDFYSFALRIFNYYWFLTTSLSNISQICPIPSENALNPVTDHTIQGFLIRLSVVNFLLFLISIFMIIKCSMTFKWQLRLGVALTFFIALGSQSFPIMWTLLLLKNYSKNNYTSMSNRKANYVVKVVN